MNKLSLFFAFFLIIFLLVSCQPPVINEYTAKNYNYVVARADNSYQLTMSQLYEYLYNSDLLQKGGILDTNIVRKFMDSVICDTLTGYDAFNIKLEDYYNPYRLFKLRYYDYLIKSYFDENVYKKVKYDSLEVVKFYNSRPDLFSVKEHINLFHILITSNGLKYGPDSLKYNSLSSEALDSATEEYVQNIRSLIKDSLSFVKAAKQYSHDTTTGRNGGYMGWVGKGIYPDPFDSIAFNMRKGDISAPYKDRDGWHILYCADYVPNGIPPLNKTLYISAQKSLKNYKANKLGKQLTDSLFKNIDITYHESLLDSNLFLINGGEWLAMVNGIDTIDCNEARSLELNMRKKFNVPNTTAKMKKEMLGFIAKRYVIIQAARATKIDTLPNVMEVRKTYYHKYAKSIIDKKRYDPDWNPSDTLIKDYYQKHLKDFLVKKPLVVQQIIVQDSVLGEFIRDQAMSGVDFMELAKKYYPGDKSIRTNLADLGAISKEDVPKPFFDAAMKIQEGDVTHPVKTKYGYHIIKVLKHRESKSLDKARVIIEPILKEQHRKEVFKKYRDNIYKRYHVTFPAKIYAVHLKPKKLRKI